MDYLLLCVDIIDNIFPARSHRGFYFLSQVLPLLFKCLLASFKGLDCLVHGVQLVQIGHCELAQTRLRLDFNKAAHVFLRILPLLHFSFEYFL